MSRRQPARIGPGVRSSISCRFASGLAADSASPTRTRAPTGLAASTGRNGRRRHPPRRRRRRRRARRPASARRCTPTHRQRGSFSTCVSSVRYSTSCWPRRYALRRTEGLGRRRRRSVWIEQRQLVGLLPRAGVADRLPRQHAVHPTLQASTLQPAACMFDSVRPLLPPYSMTIWPSASLRSSTSRG